MANYIGTSANAPTGMRPGDTYTNNSGSYTITSPGQANAHYNPESGYWSINTNDIIGQIGRSSQGTNNMMQSAADLANKISQESSAKQYEFNRQEAQKLRDWQERMSNTAHQREVQDLIKAGLNPVLSVQGGNGSTTPSGASASGGSYQGQRADVDSTTSALAQIVGVMLNNQTQRDIAQISANALVQGASLSSGAQVYSANKTFELGMNTRNPFYRIGNEMLGDNSSGNKVNMFTSALSWLTNKLGNMSKNYGDFLERK